MGTKLGRIVGICVGVMDGKSLDGATVGNNVGTMVGDTDGTGVGKYVGKSEGTLVGTNVGH